MAFGDIRLKKESNYMPYFGGLVQNQVLVMQPPTLQMKAEYNTSRAVSNHFVRYMYKIST